MVGSRCWFACRTSSWSEAKKKETKKAVTSSRQWCLPSLARSRAFFPWRQGANGPRPPIEGRRALVLPFGEGTGDDPLADEQEEEAACGIAPPPPPEAGMTACCMPALRSFLPSGTFPSPVFLLAVRFLARFPSLLSSPPLFLRQPRSHRTTVRTSRSARLVGGNGLLLLVHHVTGTPDDLLLVRGQRSAAQRIALHRIALTRSQHPSPSVSRTASPSPSTCLCSVRCSVLFAVLRVRASLLLLTSPPRPPRGQALRHRPRHRLRPGIRAHL